MLESEEKEDIESDSESESDGEKEFDVQTIVSTYTNTDNHPGVIKTTKKVVKQKVKMELHK